MSIFTIFMLGTDVTVEVVNHDNTEVELSEDCERGESLNALYRRLKGKARDDKHIMKGPNTLGKDVNVIVAEAILIVLKAISEGKRTIRLVGFSRGGIECVMIAHYVQKVIKLIEASDHSAEGVIKKIISDILTAPKKSPSRFEEHVASGFAAIEAKIDAKEENVIVFGKEKLDVTKLCVAIKDKEAAPIKAEWFVIDPVPGQEVFHVVQVYNWAFDEFFVVPEFVRRAYYRFQRGERSPLFEPAFPKKVHKQCELSVDANPGYHSTATGGLLEQGAKESKLVEIEKEGVKNTRRTRHVQKIALAHMIDFLGDDAFDISSPLMKTKRPATHTTKYPVAATLLKTIDDKGLGLEKTIIRYCQKSPQERIDYKLKQYDKILAASAQYEVFHGTKYNIPELPLVTTGFSTSEKRLVLVGVDEKGYPILKAFDDIPALRKPPFIKFVNHDHMNLWMEKYGSQLTGSIHVEASGGQVDYVITQLDYLTDCFTSPLQCDYVHVESFQPSPEALAGLNAKLNNVYIRVISKDGKTNELYYANKITKQIEKVDLLAADLTSLNKHITLPAVNTSKTLSEDERKYLNSKIKQHYQLSTIVHDSCKDANQIRGMCGLLFMMMNGQVLNMVALMQDASAAIAPEAMDLFAKLIVAKKRLFDAILAHSERAQSTKTGDFHNPHADLHSALVLTWKDMRRNAYDQVMKCIDDLAEKVLAVSNDNTMSHEDKIDVVLKINQELLKKRARLDEFEKINLLSPDEIAAIKRRIDHVYEGSCAIVNGNLVRAVELAQFSVAGLLNGLFSLERISELPTHRMLSEELFAIKTKLTTSRSNLDLQMTKRILHEKKKVITDLFSDYLQKLDQDKKEILYMQNGARVGLEALRRVVDKFNNCDGDKKSLACAREFDRKMAKMLEDVQSLSDKEVMNRNAVYAMLKNGVLELNQEMDHLITQCDAQLKENSLTETKETTQTAKESLMESLAAQLEVATNVANGFRDYCRSFDLSSHLQSHEALSAKLVELQKAPKDKTDPKIFVQARQVIAKEKVKCARVLGEYEARVKKYKDEIDEKYRIDLKALNEILKISEVYAGIEKDEKTTVLIAAFDKKVRLQIEKMEYKVTAFANADKEFSKHKRALDKLESDFDSYSDQCEKEILHLMLLRLTNGVGGFVGGLNTVAPLPISTEYAELQKVRKRMNFNLQFIMPADNYEDIQQQIGTFNVIRTQVEVLKGVPKEERARCTDISQKRIAGIKKRSGDLSRELQARAVEPAKDAPSHQSHFYNEIKALIEKLKKQTDAAIEREELALSERLKEIDLLESEINNNIISRCEHHVGVLAQKAKTFGVQMRRLEKHLSDLEENQLFNPFKNAMVRHIKYIKKSWERRLKYNPDEEAKLGGSLDVINKFLGTEDGGYDFHLLMLEAAKYKNDRRPQFQRLGAAMIVLGALCLAGLIAATILSGGVTLVPIVLSSGLFSSGAASFAMSVYAFFSARMPEINRTIENFAGDVASVAHKEARTARAA
jgi:hypothetical protein